MYKESATFTSGLWFIRVPHNLALKRKNIANFFRCTFCEERGGFTVGGGAESAIFLSGMTEFYFKMDGITEFHLLPVTENEPIFSRNCGITQKIQRYFGIFLSAGDGKTVWLKDCCKNFRARFARVFLNKLKFSRSKGSSIFLPYWSWFHGDSSKVQHFLV